MTTRRRLDHQSIDDQVAPAISGETATHPDNAFGRVPADAATSQNLTPATPTTAGLDAGTTPASAGEPEPAGDADEASRGGVDSRRRGWFWHWNNVVTQYAPLIGLKGVGLLNSYTVWTDRRDESPHRGYAFPSQQSEADFYGEDRAELITINKILVALDLIEIRKEMLTRVDERGRRWRVPHNLYRVKDRPEGVDLRAHDVMRVATLALTDDAVFRYVRRVFSERFKPIDGDNVWHRILEELRTDPTWRELQERTSAIEARASARSRAGHKRRNGSATEKAGAGALDEAAAVEGPAASPSSEIDSNLLPDTQHNDGKTALQQTSVDRSNKGSDPVSETVVARSNSGSGVVVDTGNRALSPDSSTTVGGSSNGHQPVVGPSNTTYDQNQLTTTTTTTSLRNGVTAGNAEDLSWPADQQESPDGAGYTGSTREAPAGNEEMGNGRDRGVDSSRLATSQRLATIEGSNDERQPAGTRTGSDPRERRLADTSGGGPLVDPGPLVVSTFEAANDRRATPLERHLLAELERDADPAARAAGSTGADWVVAAMREAVASGSAFVAPKRIREIITRWSANPRNAPAATSTLEAGSESRDQPNDTGDDVRLPGGASGNAIWATTLSDLSRSLDRNAFDRLLAGSRITRYWRGTAEITVAGHAAADKLSNEYRSLVERQLNSRLHRPVAVRFVVSEPQVDIAESGTQPEPGPSDDVSQPLAIDEGQVEIGRQVWQSLLADLAKVVAPSDLDRLAGVVVLGQDAGGAILLGTPSPLARRLIDRRYHADVERSLAALFGQPLPVRALDAADWKIVTSG